LKSPLRAEEPLICAFSDIFTGEPVLFFFSAETTSTHGTLYVWGIFTTALTARLYYFTFHLFRAIERTWHPMEFFQRSMRH
jgi:prolipoprotein diacylglyceryltransferase